MKLKHQYYFNTLKKMALSIPLSMTNNQHVKFFHVVSTTTHLHTDIHQLAHILAKDISFSIS